MQSLVRDLNRVYGETPALWSLDQDEQGFAWIDANDADNNVFSFLLAAAATGRLLACVANFSAVPYHGYRVGLPAAGPWSEVLTPTRRPTTAPAWNSAPPRRPRTPGTASRPPRRSACRRWGPLARFEVTPPHADHRSDPDLTDGVVSLRRRPSEGTPPVR